MGREDDTRAARCTWIPPAPCAGAPELMRVPYPDVGPIKIESDLPDEKVLFLRDKKDGCVKVVLRP